MRFDMIGAGRTLSAIGPGTWSSDIEHRLTEPNHLRSCEGERIARGTVFRSEGQVERTPRRIKDATAERFRYDDHDQLLTHLADFMAASNSARRLKTLASHGS